jgi:hypothetical protein
MGALAPTLRGLALLTALAVPAMADDLPARAATSEEVRMIALALKAEGFAPCSTLALADGRWACRTTNAAGEAMDLSLSNLDFAVTRRTRVP